MQTPKEKVRSFSGCRTGATPADGSGSHRPVFEDQTGNLPEVPSIARDQNDVVRQGNRCDFLVTRAESQTQLSNLLILTLGRLIERSERKSLKPPERFQEQRI